MTSPRPAHPDAATAAPVPAVPLYSVRVDWLRLLLVVVAWLVLALLIYLADPDLALLSLLGFAAALIAGLVGIGGAIVTIPLLLYVPPTLGFPAIDIRTVAAIALVQVVATGLVGFLGHRVSIDGRLVMTVGLGAAVASFIGGVLSADVQPIVLETIFALLVTAVAVVTVLLRHRTAPDSSGPVRFSAPRATTLGAGVGIVAGMVGAGGAFLLMPGMLFGLHVPLRSAVAASLATAMIGALAGLVGKALTGQVEWPLAAALVAGAVPGTVAGVLLSRGVRNSHLAILLSVVLFAVAIRTWVSILS